MRLRSGTIVSNMSRSSSSDDEIRGQKGESNPNSQTVEPVNVSIAGISRSPKGSSAMNNNSGAWPPYGLPARYAPPIATQGLTTPLYSMVLNPFISKCIC